MDINSGILLVALLVVIATALHFLRSGSSRTSYPYDCHRSLLSKAELAFYKSLVQAVGDGGVVFAKVRIADVIRPRKGMSPSNWQRAFNAISSKHFDFLVCALADAKVLIAIELDDASHRSPRARRRDELVDRACASAELALLRVPAARSYVPADLRARLAGLMPGSGEAPATPTAAATMTTRAGSQAGPETTGSPRCPECGTGMVLRTARSGPDSGQQFWGCGRFPACRGEVPYNE
jgi:hypothetical protein